MPEQLPLKTKTHLAFPESSHQGHQSLRQTPHDIFPVLHQPPLYILHHNNNITSVITYCIAVNYT